MKDSLVRDIKTFLEEGREKELARTLTELHPADVAEMLAQLNLEETIKILDILGIEQASDVLVELSDHSRDRVAATMPIDKLTELVAEMDSDDAADIVAELPDEDADKILAAIEPEDSEDVRRLLLYEGDSAGGIMQAELISAREEETIGQVIDKIRRNLDEAEEISSVYVVDDSNGLRGQLTAKTMLLASPDARVRELMQPCPLVVVVDENQEAVAQNFKKYDLKIAPVVDHQHCLVGIISVDDIIDVVQEEADKDFYRLVGASEEEVYSNRVLSIARLRLPWLLYNLGGGLLAGWLLWLFQNSLSQALFLVTFIPTTMSLSGAVGSQAATITVRGLALGRVLESQIGRNITKELKIALVLGCLFGAAVFIVSGFWYKLAKLSLTVGVSMLSAIIISSLLGALIPSAFRLLKIDPALSSGPVVTSTNDVLSVLIYMGVATIILGL